MSINGINQNTDIQKLLKLMKSNKGANAAASKKLPQHMTMNGSIFSVGNTISSVNQGNAKVQTRGIQGPSIATSVLSANTTKAVAGASNTSHSEGTQSSKEDKIDLSKYDFDNLTAVSNSELQDLKAELKELKISDIPRFLENSVDKKLGKVNQ